ncbi:MAG: FHA domain-containing protein [bacterium]
MRCPSCNNDNAGDARFCSECRHPLRSEGDPAGVGEGAELWIVGRSDRARVQIDLPSVSWEHVAVRNEGDALFVRDLGSTNGTWYITDKVQPVGDEEVRVGPEGALLLGSHRLPVSLLLERLGLETQSPQPVELALEEQPAAVTIGRDPGCDLVLDDPLISRRHVRVSREGEGWRVEDLHSVNGTWLENRRLHDEVVPDTVVLNLGSWEVRLSPSAIRSEPLRGQIRLDVEDVEKAVPGVERLLLHPLSFSVFPSEIVGILGDSGAGKTTLLQVIAAVEYATGGRVRLNGVSIADQFERFRGLIGYVPQDDIVHADLTPYQALYYSARLRLPSDTSDEEIGRRIDQVLEDLDLTAQRDVRIGDVQSKTLSGGQRKRVNLGMELVTDPLILFADEPTSGLSYSDSEEVVAALRKVADKGRPVIVSIHQPSGSLYAQLDLALILGRGGKLAYFGPTCPDSYQFFEAQSGQPETIFGALSSEPLETWIERYGRSEVRKRWVTERQGRELPETKGPPHRRRGIHGGRALLTLIARTMRLKFQSGRAWIKYLASPAVILLLMMFIYQGVTEPGKEVFKRANPLFFLAMSSLFFGLFNAATEIASERPIFRRERLAGLGIGPYVLSKLAVLGVLTTIQVTLLCLPALLLLRLDGSLWVQFGALLLTGWAAVTTGLLLSSLAPRPESALILVPIILIAQMLLSGFIEPIRSTGERALAAPMAIRWSTELLLHAEYTQLPRSTVKQPIPPAAIWKALYVDNRGYRFHSQGQTAATLLLLAILYLLLTALVLRVRDPAVLRRRRRLPRQTPSAC